MSSVDTRPEQNLHPEGMTPNQERLVELFLTTKTLGKVRRRYPAVDGGYRFETITRELGVVDFAQDEFEFAIKQHDKEPEAPLSPFYLNIRNLSDEVLSQCSVVLREMEPFFEREGHLPHPDICAGVPNAGVPIADSYSKISGIPMVEIFDKEEHADGTRKILHKDSLGEGASVRLIDDLASQGLTKLESVKEAREMGYRIDSFFVLVDRMQGGIEELRKVVPNVKAAVTIKQILEYGLRTQKISREQYERAYDYLSKTN